MNPQFSLNTLGCTQSNKARGLNSESDRTRNRNRESFEVRSNVSQAISMPARKLLNFKIYF